jgi:hypothetical protein
MYKLISASILFRQIKFRAKAVIKLWQASLDVHVFAMNAVLVMRQTYHNKNYIQLFL